LAAQELEDSEDELFTTSLRDRVAMYNAKVPPPTVAPGKLHQLEDRRPSVLNYCLGFGVFAVWYKSF
jgi:hypothetical protein